MCVFPGAVQTWPVKILLKGGVFKKFTWRRYVYICLQYLHILQSIKGQTLTGITSPTWYPGLCLNKRVTWYKHNSQNSIAIRPRNMTIFKMLVIDNALSSHTHKSYMFNESRPNNKQQEFCGGSKIPVLSAALTKPSLKTFFSPGLRAKPFAPPVTEMRRFGRSIFHSFSIILKSVSISMLGLTRIY